MEDHLTPEEEAAWDAFKPLIRNVIIDQLPIRVSQLEVEVDALKRTLEQLSKDIRPYRRIGGKGR